MSLPPIDPSRTVSGIAVDPRTLERVVPETKRPDGSVRKELKIRPGFTPQEDVSRFRGSKQQQLDRNALPKGHIIGWVAPSSEAKKPAAKEGAMSKSQKKNEKRREKKKEEKERVIKDSWEDSDDDIPKVKSKQKAKAESEEAGGSSKDGEGVESVTDRLKQTAIED